MAWVGGLRLPDRAAIVGVRPVCPHVSRISNGHDFRATLDKMTALRSASVGSKIAVYRVAPAGAPPNSRVMRVSRASKRGSPCKCLSRGSLAK